MALQKIFIKEYKNQDAVVLRDQKKLTNTNSLPYSITTSLRNLQLCCFPAALLSCLQTAQPIKILFTYRQSETGDKHALLTVLCSLFLSGQMQTYWCPLWWLFLCPSDKVPSSFLMRSPGLHLRIFEEKIPGEEYHGRFPSCAFHKPSVPAEVSFSLYI